MSELETMFWTGDRVWGVERHAERLQVPCEFCAGCGLLTGADGTRRACPVCSGRGGAVAMGAVVWSPTSHALTIGQVRLEVTASPGVPGEEMWDNYAPQESRMEVYMAVETGVGSGRVWDVTDLFASLEEAQASCEQRNGADREAEGVVVEEDVEEDTGDERFGAGVCRTGRCDEPCGQFGGCAR